MARIRHEPRTVTRPAPGGPWSGATPAARLAMFIGAFSAPIGKLGAACVERMRRRYPGAVVLVYDNFNALAIGFGPNERASDAVFSIAMYPRRVNLCFLQAGRSKLKDPGKLLQGSGRLNRFIPLASVDQLDEPAVRALMDQALAAAGVSLGSRSKGNVVIKSVSPRRRPRRLAARG